RGGGHGGARQVLGCGARGASRRRRARHHDPLRSRCRRGLDVRAHDHRPAPAPARPARRAHREVRMMAGRAVAKYRPVAVAALATVVMPFAMLAVGLTVNTATVVVILSIAAIGLNLLVGFTGLTSFGQSAWFGIGAYAAAL